MHVEQRIKSKADLDVSVGPLEIVEGRDLEKKISEGKTTKTESKAITR